MQQTFSGNLRWIAWKMKEKIDFLWIFKLSSELAVEKKVVHTFLLEAF